MKMIVYTNDISYTYVDHSMWRMVANRRGADFCDHTHSDIETNGQLVQMSGDNTTKTQTLMIL